MRSCGGRLVGRSVRDLHGGRRERADVRKHRHAWPRGCAGAGRQEGEAPRRQVGSVRRRCFERPFVAIARGRQRLALGEIGWWRTALSLCAVFRSAIRALLGFRCVAIALDVKSLGYPG